MEQWGYGVMGNTGYSYAPKKNYLYNLNNDYAGAVRNVYCMKIKITSWSVATPNH